MTDETVYYKQYPDIAPVNTAEVWRYAGYKGGPSESEPHLHALLDETINEILPKLSYRICYRQLEDKVIFMATIGLELDRAVSRYEKFNPTKALLADALGSERIESLCDTFCDEYSKQLFKDNLYITKRISPGYGSLPLEKQTEFFRLLDRGGRLGVSLNKSLLMSPSKSVTAVFGITESCEATQNKRSCKACDLLTCQYRRL